MPIKLYARATAMLLLVEGEGGGCPFLHYCIAGIFMWLKFLHFSQT